METTTIKVWKNTLNNLKILAALQGKTMMSILDGLVFHALKEEQQKKAGWLNTGLNKQGQP